MYFVATGVLTSTPNSQGQTAQPGTENLYVVDTETGTTDFIATATVYERGLSDNGRFLIFTTSADLTPDDSTVAQAFNPAQAFEYDSQTGALVRVSVGQDGYNNDGNTNEAPLDEPHSVLVADDGTAFFESGDALTPQAIDNDLVNSFLIQNVYEYRDGNVYLISDGHDTSGEVSLTSIDPSGANVFFQTASQLAPQDGDSEVDTYDARVDGGFPAPSSPPPCVADACQGALSAAPTLLSPGSEFQAGGNPPLAASMAAKPAVKPKPKKKPKSKKKGKKAKKSSRDRRAR